MATGDYYNRNSVSNLNRRVIIQYVLSLLPIGNLESTVLDDVWMLEDHGQVLDPDGNVFHPLACYGDAPPRLRQVSVHRHADFGCN